MNFTYQAAIFICAAVPLSPRALTADDWPYVDVTDSAGINFVGTVGAPFPDLPTTPGFQDALDIVFRTNGSGAAIGDYDGDGDLDIYLLAYEGFTNILLRNELNLGMKSFTNVTATAGVADVGLSRVAQFADLDNDGDLDLLVVNDNDETASHPPSRIFRNDGDGTFSDVTQGSGFHPLGYILTSAALADYDLDGLLDVYVAAWTHDVGPFSYFPFSNRLYRNLGNLVFEDVTAAVGHAEQTMNAYGALFTDLNGDLRPDIHVAVDGWPDRLYWNTPSGFMLADESVGANHPGNDMGIACTDFDDDGDLDLYTTNITGPFFGLPESNCLYQNEAAQNGNTAFSNVAESLGVEDTFWGWGVEFTDVENDGQVDLVAATGFDALIEHYQGTDHPLYGTPSVLFRQQNATFTRHLGPDTDDSRALIAFDYDRDGDEDLLVTNVNGPARLWENTSAGAGHWLEIAVRQTRGNQQGIGVKVSARIGSTTRTRVILAGESFLSGGPAEVHFGLGDAASVDELRVYWTDGTTTIVPGVAVNQFMTIVQPVLGDLDEDCDVDINDLLLLLGGWGGSSSVGDLNGDGSVTVEDLLILLGNWGPCPR